MCNLFARFRLVMETRMSSFVQYLTYLSMSKYGRVKSCKNSAYRDVCLIVMWCLNPNVHVFFINLDGFFVEFDRALAGKSGFRLILIRFVTGCC